MNVEALLNELEELLDQARGLPLSGGRRMVDTQRALDLIDDIRQALPVEVQKAREIVRDRAQILADARKEAQDIMRHGQERAKLLVSRDEIVREAKLQANEMLGDAQQQARQIKRAANEFACSLLDNTERVLAQAHGEVKTTRQALKNQMLR